MIKFWGFASLLLLFPCWSAQLIAQGPSLFMTQADFSARKQVAEREPWAKKSLSALLKEADDFPRSYTQRFGLTNTDPPPEGGQWLHWYACPESGTALQFHPPDKNICPETGRNFSGYPYDHVVYQLRNDALAEAAVALGLAFRFTDRRPYAERAAKILNDYARVYPGYALHDNYGKPTPNGAKAYSQTLDESIWLIKIAWAYDLIRGSGVLTTEEKQEIETKVLRASASTVMKAHKEPTFNIQSWINSAIGAVGFTLNDPSLIHEAIDGPIGFRHQMHTFVQEGFWAEGAWGYQFYAMRALTMLAQMAKEKGVDLWTEEPNLLALFHSPLGVVLPDGRLPAFNDSGSPDLYNQDYLYEVAYASTHDPSLLTVIEHGPRSDREAFLFGTEDLPRSSAPKLVSAVFPKAGFATLRSNQNDLTVVMKFGPHGGAHGHFDKLNFVLFSHGRILAIDPGTHPYGLPIHREWDSMTIAHNTISVDEQRQAAATGKLLDWQTGDGWTAVSAAGGTAYSMASLRRSILLTPEYVLILDHCESQDGKPHLFDWAYHNVGKASPGEGLLLRPFQLSATNGYQHLSNTRRAFTSKEIAVSFRSETAEKSSEAEHSNSTPATYRFPTQLASLNPRRDISVDLSLQMLPAPATEVILGNSPNRGIPPAVSFVIARRSGTSVIFATVLQISSPNAPSGKAKLRFKQSSSGELIVQGEHFTDTFSDTNKLSFHRSKN
ncbi:MAG TPA: alginate lyase family protein [Edaphobacter sp.]|nr:alginate lyase family protein [Edaphobacter sp.]